MSMGQSDNKSSISTSVLVTGKLLTLGKTILLCPRKASLHQQMSALESKGVFQ